MYLNAAIQCDDSTYVYDCIMNCSGLCLNGSSRNNKLDTVINDAARDIPTDCSRGMFFTPVSEHFQCLLSCGRLIEFYIHNLFVHMMILRRQSSDE